MSASANSYKIMLTARPAFLLLTPCCLLLAVACAAGERLPIDYPDLALIVIGALAAHGSVNMFNEYGDYISGLDMHTQRTPFSGGSGTLPATPELANSVRMAAFACLLLTVAIGGYFIWKGSWGLLPIGCLGILLIVFYTDKITHVTLLCLIAPGLAFGPLMINGAYYVLRGHYSAAVFSVSLIVFFLVNNLLLLNQFPDVEADRESGRHHLPILLGRQKSAWIYVIFLASAYGVLLLNVWASYLPIFSLSALAGVPLAVYAGKLAVRHADDIEKLKPALAVNVVLSLATPVLVATGIILQPIFG